LKLTGFQPFRHDDMRADTDAALQISGNLAASQVKGRIHLNSAEFRVPDRLPPDVAEVERVGKDVVDKKKTEPPEPAHKKTPSMGLDVRVEIPGRAFVRGNGLESEWKGDLKLTGSSQEHELRGTLSVVRGFYDLFGKRFVLRSGGLRFDGPVQPSMDVTADFKGKEITAVVRLYGRLESLKLDLSSDPPYPSDEILSRILFGRETARLTPVQALRLAQAANRLSGGKRVFDPLDKARQVIGVDQLDVRQEKDQKDSEDETTLSVGKYVRDDVYLEVEKGTGRGSGKVSVEVELTPNITLESEAREDASGGLGLNWKWDY
jgi:autotransporter translocation and assembly factor TamB